MRSQEQFLAELETYCETHGQDRCTYGVQCDRARLECIRAVIAHGDDDLARRCTQWLLLEHLDSTQGNELDADEAREVEWARLKLAELGWTG